MQTTSWDDLRYPGKATDFFSRCAFPAFDASASGYSAGNALLLMELSRLVYRHDAEEEADPPQPSRTSFLEKAGLRQRRFFLSRKTNTQAMLVEPMTGPPYAVLAFRGTEQNIKDVITDLRFLKEELSREGASVHHGFEDALEAVWNEIDAELKKLDCPVFYTGHSLGAALATLAAARRRPAVLYTFGSPRVGNEQFTALLDGLPVHRVVDDMDIVTHLPPEAFGFTHTGRLYKLKERLGWSPRGILIRVRRLFGHPSKEWADHAPVNYVDRLARTIE